MIKELSLKNFRGFEDHSIPFTQTTIVVGKNNAGKSTVVEALRLLSLVTNRYKSLSFHAVPRWLDVSRKEKGVSPSLRAIEIHLESVFHRYGDPPAVIVATFTTGESITIYLGPEAQIHAVIRNKDGDLVTRPSQAQRITLPKVSILPQIAPLPDEELVLNRDYIRRFMGTSRSSLHFRNQLNLFYENFDAFKSLAEETWPGLRIKELDGREQLPGTGNLSLMVQDSDFVAEVGWMGHGLQMWLQTIWFLTYSNDSDTIILDEPDVYMHADLQRRLIRFLKRGQRQVIIATHSTEIMAEVEPEEVLVVDRKRRRSRFASGLLAVQQVLNQFGSLHNIQLARLWSSKVFLLVEGDDTAFLKRFQNILYPESMNPIDAIPSMPIGGWSGWKYAIGSSMFLKNAGGEHITRYCILDSDYHPQSQIDERYEEAGTNNVQLHIWSRKEIENYLLIPSAIHKIISTERSDRRISIKLADVEEKLESLIEGVKEEVFDALSTELLSLNKAAGVAPANRLARARIVNAWRSREGRLSIVPGKKMISLLSGWSQQTYGVSLSPIRIASALSPDEIHPEVASVIRCIEEHADFENAS